MELLEKSEVLTHSWVIGELDLGALRNRDEILHLPGAMPMTPVVSDAQVLQFVSQEKIYGLDIGPVDALLLASARSTSGTLVWTRDHRLADLATRFDVLIVRESSNP